ncbi:abortive phage infection protein [Leptolyngbya sp. 'hensonii']|uniref:CPBP family glutamic-type intramembrane protease n=1 Tax=Leptolyngbya sp. 'hensonii' TaxID=1922337 RepID=UPI00094FCDE1|nr:CPBP family glutamic-type intramembrane protease [Leptolyngbya sp. 'hensonii']OLP18074.1 abortive phage infection protein [Leptolyngbya sp. 'hensonii']
MTPKRIFLGFLTIVAIAILALSLAESWNQPQIQSRLELYQTNLLLQASEWRGEEVEISRSPQTSETTVVNPLRTALLGSDPIKNGLEEYQEVRASAQKNLAKTEVRLEKLHQQATSQTAPSIAPDRQVKTELQELQQTLNRLEKLIAELDLRLGLLQIEQKQVAAALKTWDGVISRFQNQPQLLTLTHTAEILKGLWQNPPQLLPDAEPLLKQNLDSWFRHKALFRLYDLSQREDSLITLLATEQVMARQAISKLTIVGSIPALGFLIGVGLLIFLLIQWVTQGKESLLGRYGDQPWTTPWSGETIWQVFIVGFFLTGQILVPYLILPIVLKLLNLEPATFDERTRAFSILLSYALLALGGIAVLYWSLQPFLPLPEGWFRFKVRENWFWWGLGGYLVALPLVILVSLLNQLIWQGQGGSNPILPIALEGRDGTALLIFFLTASVAAPLFEEFMFRGFLLPSLTRYLSVRGAIVASSLLFAIAHLSLSEILPLATLGMILGVVYTRSRNLLAPMLLHSLWNSGTLLSLYILGSGAR